MLKPVLRAFLRSAKLFTFPYVVHIVPAFNLDYSIKWGQINPSRDISRNWFGPTPLNIIKGPM